ncbi:uncharacterized protein LOC143550039 [Bidens hawaiensis]|uniref:uncharacterized protein LOC143550039 n=1 Tax=Bidens hawaiensis TaxID=980011 RepID=UPI004049582C
MAGKDDSTTAKTQNQTQNTDHSSPYYLHPSDYPRQMQVNEPLNDNNYLDWSQEMENFLFAKNKISFVDGSLIKPEAADPNYNTWLRCDAMIKGWLTTAMEKEIQTSVKYETTSEEMWNDLRERFGKVSAPRAYELKQLLSLTKQDGTSVSAYYTLLKAIWDEIRSVFPAPRCSCGECKCDVSKTVCDLRDKERLYEFLLGLDSDYSTIRTQLLAMKPTPTLGEAYRLVSEDEQQKAVTGGRKISPDNTVAFQTRVKRDGPGNSNKWQSRNARGGKNDKEGHCDFCNKDGHKREGCFKLVGYPGMVARERKNREAKPESSLCRREPSPGAKQRAIPTIFKHVWEERSDRNPLDRKLCR